MRRALGIAVVALLAACTTPEEPPPPAPAAPMPIPAPPPSAAIMPGSVAAKLAMLKPGRTTRKDAEKLLGAPNETETDKTPCGAGCMRTTVVWTYFQVRNGKSNADSVTEPVTLTFDQQGTLQAVGGS